jgi:CubicO group peptidase (beta-lactamase class C family)
MTHSLSSGMAYGALLGAIASAVLLASCASPLLKPDGRQTIDALMASYDSTGFPGASVAVLDHGTPVFQKGYGLAAIEDGTPVTPATNFRLASMTKQFTAMCIMMLKEQGRLQYTDPITRFIPGLPAYCGGMTVRHLLTHTSGLPDYESLIPDSQTVQVKDADIPELLSKTDSMYFLPGEKYSYSNTGYALLALIVENVSGERFGDFLKAHLFAPLGMKSTIAFEDGVNAVEHRAYGYSRRMVDRVVNAQPRTANAAQPAFVRDDQSVTSAVLGDGGIYSNTDDLAKWDAALYTERLVSRATLDEAFADAALADGTPIDYGYGWHKETFLGIRHPYHDGSTRGFRNTILRFPEQKLSVIILTNRNEGDPRAIAKKIAELYLNR